ncbi:uncharacterized protein LOC6054237 isoform X2 [Culex quinquefasciatus]|uniref:uncharacterized protein LOC6054237 isoform X2 n=1 Tax=Culex quinquefasciatus TaxID=7176 RepID=UPI0018E3DB47|nr:uncharacterized protein LOC6054237 isoform X2 [Culex quinquefasciatus]
MRKTWVKRDNIYYKPFYKQKLKMTLLGVLLMAFVFFGYQFFYIRNNGAGGKQPSNNNAVQDEGGGGGGDGNRTADFRGPSEDARYVYVEKVGSYEKRILRGIRLRDLDAYQPGSSAAFRCLSSTRHVSWARVNDDYCDCPEDGSDEPGTGACDRGRFYCRFQKRHATGRGGYTSVPSGWANDGVCDCCDGSDEWLSGADCRNTCKERFPY